MLQAVSRFLIARSSTRLVVTMAAITLILVGVFGVYLVPGFAAVSGGRLPLDLQFPLTPSVIFAELAVYDEAARRLYLQFLIVDMLYPPALAVFLLTWWVRILDTAGASAWLERPGSFLWMWPLAAALLDWSENIGLALMIWDIPGGASRADLLALLVTGLRAAKLLALQVSFLTTLVLACWWLWQRYNQPR